MIDCPIPGCDKQFQDQRALNGHLMLLKDPGHKEYYKQHRSQKTGVTLQKTQSPLLESGNIREIIQTLITDQRTNHALREDLRELLSEDRELTDRRVKEIEKNYFETTIKDQFKEGWWLEKKDHENKIEELNKKHKSELNQLNVSHWENKANLEDLIDTFQNDNLTLADKNRELHDYIDNHLDNAGRLEKEEAIRQRALLSQERASFNEHEETQEKILRDLYKEVNTRQIKLDKKDKELDDQGKELDISQKQIEAKTRKEEHILKENKQVVLEDKQVLQTIDEGLQKIKNEMDALRQERADLKITTIELSEIRRNEFGKKAEEKAMALDRLSK